MKIFLFLCGSFLLGFAALSLVDSFAFDGDYFVFDPVGNLYAITDKSVSLMDENRIVVRTFSQTNQGEIASVDVSNPMKILVFYRSSGQVVFLDNQLNFHNDPLDLYQLVDRDIQLVVHANNNYYWMYDQFANQIIRVDRYMNVSNSSGVLSGFLPTDFVPIKMLQKNEYLYVLSRHYGLAVFDVFGSFLYRVPLENTSDFQIENNRVVYQKNNALCFYNLLTHTKECVELPVDSNAVIKKQGTRYFSLWKREMKVFE